MLKADDAKTKDIWIAKLYEFAGHGKFVVSSIINVPLLVMNTVVNVFVGGSRVVAHWECSGWLGLWMLGVVSKTGVGAGLKLE